MSFNITIPNNANTIIHTLQSNGYTAYVVGGCVRDSLMGRTPHDWDICTSATPEQMLDIFKDYRVIETGLKHGTVTIVVDGEQYECTTYRIDGVYSDNRRPDNVTFTDDLVQDLQRRDFTINAMAYNDAVGLVDPFHGVRDIANEVIQCVGNPTARFTEDALRMMRALRFSAQFGFQIAKETQKAITAMRGNLSNIAAERISSELCKLLCTQNAGTVIQQNVDTICEIIPEMRDTVGFVQNNLYHEFDVFEHTIHALNACDTQELTVRLAILLHDIGKPHCYQYGTDGYLHFKGHGKVSAEMADTILKRLKFDNDTRNKVVQLVYFHDATIEVGKKYIKRWLNKMGESQFRKLLIIRKADIKGQRTCYDTERYNKICVLANMLDEVLQEKACFTLKDLAVNGTDLMQVGYVAGKQLGITLNRLLDCVMDGTVINDTDILVNLTATWLKEEI